MSTFVDQELVAKYKNHSVQSLKKALKQLKNNSAPSAEIQHVSHLLRSTLRSTSNQSTRFSIPHKQLDQFISKNFWGFVKTVLDKPSKILPSFSKETCIHYFIKILSSTWPNRKFIIPSWIPSLQKPTIPFNFEPPSYEKVTNVIRRTKTSGSPSPLDQSSIICFKRCPYLRTLLTNTIRAIYKSGRMPEE